jgi:hypothetical protein
MRPNAPARLPPQGDSSDVPKALWEVQWSDKPNADVNGTDVSKRLALSSIVFTMTAAVVASVAAADIVVIAVRPATARAGQVAQIDAGAYKAFALPMPLYLVPVAHVPKRSVFPAPPRGLRSAASAALTSVAIRVASPRGSVCRASPAAAMSSSSTAILATAVAAAH